MSDKPTKMLGYINVGLAAEARDIYNETGLTPRQMQDQRNKALAALEGLVKSLSDQDDEGLIEHAAPFIAARAALSAAERKA